VNALPRPTAVLLIAHGSRRPEANADARCVAAGLLGEGRYPIVETAYLELVEPDIATAGAACVARGAGRVVLLPYFLSPGVHARDDLAGARQALAGRFPDVEFLLAEPLGGHPHLVEVLTARAVEAEARTTPAPPTPAGA
jgi:sirohydrochlorin ferrochelatase